MNKTVKRNYKDGIFRTLFNDEAVLLELYSALSGKEYPENTEIKIVTLDNVIFNDIKDDLAFIVEDKFIILTEQQSTLCPNMPVRMLCYLDREYEKLINKKSIFSTTLQPVPTPELYMFYNGTEDKPSEWTMKLSDAFIGECDIISVEAIIKVINVNYESGAELLQKCRTLREYSFFIHKVRTYYEEIGDLEHAVETAIKECISDDILPKFLSQQKGAIMSVLEVNLTREERDKVREHDGYIKGKAEGHAEIAARMKADGMPHEMIMKYTGMTENEIEQL